MEIVRAGRSGIGGAGESSESSSGKAGGEYIYKKKLNIDWKTEECNCYKNLNKINLPVGLKTLAR